MTDPQLTEAARVVAAHMEPKPDSSLRQNLSTVTWWIWDWIDRWVPTPLSLDRLHLVEATLTEEQWQHYEDLMVDPIEGESVVRPLLHADAATRLLALAEALKPEEGK